MLLPLLLLSFQSLFLVLPAVEYRPVLVNSDETAVLSVLAHCSRQHRLLSQLCKLCLHLADKGLRH